MGRIGFHTTESRKKAKCESNKKFNKKYRVIDKGIKKYLFIMERFYTRKIRYKMLRKDFEEIQQMKIAA